MGFEKPRGKPISHSTKLGLSVRLRGSWDGWDELGPALEDSLPDFSLSWPGREGRTPLDAMVSRDGVPALGLLELTPFWLEP